MPTKIPRIELAEIRAQQRLLHLREAVLLAHLHDGLSTEPALAPRPGWPMLRVPECRAT